MDVNKMVGSWLRSIREEKNIKQVIIANKLGISQSKVSKIERGMIDITITIVMTYCLSLNTSLRDFSDMLNKLV